MRAALARPRYQQVSKRQAPRGMRSSEWALEQADCALLIEKLEKWLDRQAPTQPPPSRASARATPLEANPQDPIDPDEPIE